MKFLLGLGILALMIPVFARAEAGDGMPDDSMSLPERTILLKKISAYRGKVSGNKKVALQNHVRALLKNKDQIADLDFTCAHLNPLNDNDERIQVLSCETSFIVPRSNGRLAEIEFGTNSWEPKIARITDITYKSCEKGDQVLVPGSKGKVLACKKKSSGGSGSSGTGSDDSHSGEEHGIPDGAVGLPMPSQSPASEEAPTKVDATL